MNVPFASNYLFYLRHSWGIRQVSLLKNNRIDGIIMVDLVADQQIAELKRANIARLEPPFYRQPIYMVFSHASTIPDKTRFAIWSQLAKSKIVIDNTP